MRPFELVSASARESALISRVQVKMRALQPVVLMSVGHEVRDWFLLVEALLVHSRLGKVWLDDMKLAQMPSALALIADTHIGIMMAEVGLC